LEQRSQPSRQTRAAIHDRLCARVTMV
jgi:hypothetical protein